MRIAVFLTLALPSAIAKPTTSISSLATLKSIVERAPPPGANATLRSVSTSGSGCADNSAAFLLNGLATAAFDSMVVSNPDLAKRCVIVIDYGLNSGWKYTINKATHARGYVSSASADFSAKYTIGGQTSQAVAEIRPVSNSDGLYSLNLKQDLGVNSACGGGVSTIDISLKLTGTQGIVALDSLDIDFDYIKC